MSSEPIRTLVRAGLLGPEQVESARPIIASWTEDEAAEVECWAADYHLSCTDFVSFGLDAAPAPLQSLLDGLGVGSRLDGYRT